MSKRQRRQKSEYEKGVSRLFRNFVQECFSLLNKHFPVGTRVKWNTVEDPPFVGDWDVAGELDIFVITKIEKAKYNCIAIKCRKIDRLGRPNGPEKKLYLDDFDNGSWVVEKGAQR